MDRDPIQVLLPPAATVALQLHLSFRRRSGYQMQQHKHCLIGSRTGPGKQQLMAVKLVVIIGSVF